MILYICVGYGIRYRPPVYARKDARREPSAGHRYNRAPVVARPPRTGHRASRCGTHTATPHTTRVTTRCDTTLDARPQPASTFAMAPRRQDAGVSVAGLRVHCAFSTGGAAQQRAHKLLGPCCLPHHPCRMHELVATLPPPAHTRTHTRGAARPCPRLYTPPPPEGFGMQSYTIPTRSSRRAA